MGRVLKGSIRVPCPGRPGRYLDFGPGTSEDELVAAGVTVKNPSAWQDEPSPTEVLDDRDDHEELGGDTADILEAPPRVGKGSGRDAWAAFATAHDVDVDEEMNRDDIVAACEAADLPG